MKKIILIAFFTILISLDLVFNILNLKETRAIKKDVYFLDIDINSVGSSISEIQDDLNEIKNSVDYIEYSLY